MRLGMPTVVVFGAVAATGCFGGGEKHAAIPADSARIVPWSAIGSARLGMSRDDIEKTYGRPTKTERLTSYFPIGTRYQGKRLELSRYSVRRGSIGVWYVDQRAKVLETASPRYRTPDGLGAGIRVRGRQCGQFETTVCVRNFRYDDCTGLLLRTPLSPTGVHLELSLRGFQPRRLVHQGARIRRIVFGDEDVLLTCF